MRVRDEQAAAPLALEVGPGPLHRVEHAGGHRQEQRSAAPIEQEADHLLRMVGGMVVEHNIGALQVGHARQVLEEGDNVVRVGGVTQATDEPSLGQCTEDGHAGASGWRHGNDLVIAFGLPDPAPSLPEGRAALVEEPDGVAGTQGAVQVLEEEQPLPLQLLLHEGREGQDERKERHLPALGWRR